MLWFISTVLVVQSLKAWRSTTRFKNHPTNIQMRIEGVAASAASFIAMAGNSILIERMQW